MTSKKVELHIDIEEKMNNIIEITKQTGDNLCTLLNTMAQRIVELTQENEILKQKIEDYNKLVQND